MGVYQIIGGLLKTALGFYFRRIERFGLENVPLTGPVLFASNHPNSLTDAFVVGAAVPRKVQFLATIQLFKLKPVAWLLKQAGVIPVNRAGDRAQAMRSVLATFEAVYRVLESDGAVGIFPEGITYDAPHLQEIKNGAARMALELEHRHKGKLGLKIVPMGLNYAAKERYRSELLVNFGKPIEAASYLADYEEKKRERIRELTADIESRLKELILHISDEGRARVVAGVCRLYLKTLALGNVVIDRPMGEVAEEHALRKTIAAAVDYAFEKKPEESRAFAERLRRYENWLERLKLSDDAVRGYAGEGEGKKYSALRAAGAVLFGPIALYGWLHRFLPLAVVDWAVARYANVQKHKAQIGTTAIVAGILAFGAFYGPLIYCVHLFWGWPQSLFYGLSLPVAGLVAHYYVKSAGRLVGSLRGFAVLARMRLSVPRILFLRKSLIRDIEIHRRAYREQVSP